MFWRDITLSVWRKKTTGLKTKKRLLPLVLAAALCSSPVWAEEATFTANFKDTDLKSFIETVGANLNKTIIMGPGVQGKVSIRTMTPLNERQYYQLFLNLLEAQGYAVVPMENDVLKVVKSSAAKVEPLPLVGEGSDNYAGDEMVEADSARHARQLLRGKELIPVHIEARMNTSSGGMLQRRRHAHRRVAAADLALFTRQLATLVQAAMPLETCLQAVSEQSEKLHVKSLGMALRSRIQEGYTLSDSLREHPRVFDSLFCSMVAAGEKSGHLDVVLNRLADYTEQRQRLKSRLLQAMLYPLVLLVVATGVVTILLTAVVPKIIEQFDHLGHALPVSTRTLIAMSDALQASGVYWLAGLLGLLVLGQRLLKNPAMRLRWDKTLLRLPVIGRVARGLNTARFSRTLSILTASSVPLTGVIQLPNRGLRR